MTCRSFNEEIIFILRTSQTTLSIQQKQQNIEICDGLQSFKKSTAIFIFCVYNNLNDTVIFFIRIDTSHAVKWKAWSFFFFCCLFPLGSKKYNKLEEKHIRWIWRIWSFVCVQNTHTTDFFFFEKEENLQAHTKLQRRENYASTLV